MKGQRDIASFVLRFTQDIWRDDGGEPRVEWRGHIRRVQDGEELRFKDIADAMTFIQNSLMQVTANAVPQEDQSYRDKAMQQSLKIWEEFAQNYTNLFVNAMEKSVKQSEEFQKQMSEAVEQVLKPWWLVGMSPQPSPKAATPTTEEKRSSVDTQILQTLAALQSQIQDLNNKVDQLEQEKRTKK
ncbi:MAG: hypothetical protein R2867_14300 [Caldilineaceae bacterium]